MGNTLPAVRYPDALVTMTHIEEQKISQSSAYDYILKGKDMKISWAVVVHL